MDLREVFEPVINFVKGFQKKERDNSKIKAKERLQLVLMQDRASVSPDFFEMMKKEIIEVIKKYIEIDEEALEVQLTRGFEGGLEGPALYANIPIKNVKPVAKKTDATSVSKCEDEILNEVVSEEAEEEEVIIEQNDITEQEIAEIPEVIEDCVVESDNTEVIEETGEVEEVAEDLAAVESTSADEDISSEKVKSEDNEKCIEEQTQNDDSSSKRSSAKASTSKKKSKK